MKKLMMAAMMAAAFVATADEWDFTYQAELRDEKGVKPITGSQTVEIRLWDASTGGDAPLWGRSYNILADTNGLFNVAVSDDAGSVVTELTAKDMPKLASVLASQSHKAGGVYIGLTVKGSAGEIVPRQRLYAVPFAATANAARSLVGDNVSVAGTLNLDGNTSFSKSGITLANGSFSSGGAVKATTVTASGKLTANGGIETTDIAFSGTLKQKGTEVIPVPVGGIIMWTKAALPDNEHWAVCDGTTKNGVKTPDLRGRFVVGVKSDDGDYSAVGKTGGEKTHKLTTQEMPAHRHHLGNGNDWWHVEVDDSTDFGFSVPYAYADKHGITGSSGHDSKGDTNSIGGDQAHENRPPYYALYYIMRVK